jgi:hypothetical protein
MRFWMSWWGGADGDCRPLKTEGAPAWACSGHRDPVPQFSICAVVDADTEIAAWEHVRHYWPEAEERFAIEKPDDWTPEPSRFGTIVAALAKAD